MQCHQSRWRTIYHLQKQAIKSFISDSGRVYHQAIVDESTCNNPAYIRRYISTLVQGSASCVTSQHCAENREAAQGP